MDWYYARNGEQVGPVSESDFDDLVREGTIIAETLVWCPGMAQWTPYGNVQAGGTVTALAPEAQGAGTCICAECGNPFPADEMVRYADFWVCAVCKPVFFQRLREGAPLRGAVAYGGFWIRFAAKFIDGIILWVVNMAVNAAFMALASLFGETAMIFGYFLAMLAGLVVSVAYTTWFVGRFAATPGKMACGLKVVRPDGGQVSYLRALGRHFAEMLSALILYIGYIMAAFDEEKRTLHDRICDTRVVYR